MVLLHLSNFKQLQTLIFLDRKITTKLEFYKDYLDVC